MNDSTFSARRKAAACKQSHPLFFERLAIRLYCRGWLSLEVLRLIICTGKRGQP